MTATLPTNADPMAHGETIRAEAAAQGLKVDTGTIFRFGYWQSAYKASGVLCADGKRRTVKITGEADTYFQPSRCGRDSGYHDHRIDQPCRLDVRRGGR